MAYTTVYSRINWENEPSINTPINATNLNAIDYAVYVHDQTLSNWDLTKANETDLLLCVKEITYDSDSGEFLFTWQNGTTLAVDLNIEKIPVSFSMSPQGVITMTTEDGSTYTADVGALIKTYTFTDSSVIDFTVTTDIDGNKTVTADIVDGSITGQKLQPNYLADCVSAKTDAETAEGLAEDSAEDSEAWANGTRNGVPVTSSDPAYHNNSKYWSEQSNPTSLVGLTDTDINNPTNGQTLIYNSTSQKWENQNGGSASLSGLSDVDLTTPTDGQVLTYDLTNQEWVNADIGASGGSNITVTTTEATLYGQNVTISDGVTTLTETFSPSGVAVFEGVTLTGQLTIASLTYSTTLNVPYFGNYEPILSGFTATITVTFPADSTCTCTKSGETQTAYVSPHTFSVHSTGTYTITATDGVHTKSDTVTITTDGQSESVTLTYVPDGSTVTPTDDIQTWLACGGITDKSYTTLSEVLSDTTTLSTLIADNNAVDYMVRSKSWAGIGLVPKMTSNTTPSGVASASDVLGQHDSSEAWNAFNIDSQDYWQGSHSGKNALYTEWVSYTFTEATIVSKFYWETPAYKTTANLVTTELVLYGNNGGADTELIRFTDANGISDGFKDIPSNKQDKYLTYKLSVTQKYSGGSWAIPVVQLLQFYDTNLCADSTAMSYIGLNNYCANTLLADNDWITAICNSAYFESVLNAKVPVMTDNTTPSGECFGSSAPSGVGYYFAFNGFEQGGWYASPTAPNIFANDYIGYKFSSNIKVYLACVLFRYSQGANSINGKIQAKVNDSWEDATSVFTASSASGNPTSAYVYKQLSYSGNGDSFRFYVTSQPTASYHNGLKVQFYGRQDV